MCEDGTYYIYRKHSIMCKGRQHRLEYFHGHVWRKSEVLKCGLHAQECMRPEREAGGPVSSRERRKFDVCLDIPPDIL